jgi:Carboxypeptidase regulatory-like domain
MMQFRKFRIILVLLVMSGCFSSGQTQSGSGTGIEGVITFGPTQGGPIRADTPSSKPLPNATFVVENEKGAEVTSFTTDDQGRFRVPLTPGHYTVSKEGKKHGIGHYGPFDVDVVAGRMTSVQWECDTGIR